MKVDLNTIISFHIEGEVSKNNTLPIDYFIKISRSLQDLIISLAKNGLKDEFAVDYSNFKIEVCGFGIGSAVPEYKFTNEINHIAGVDVFDQRKHVSEAFNTVLEIADSGDYSKVINLYDSPEARNEIIDKIYNYTNSFGDSLVHVIEYKAGKMINLYENHKLNTEARDKLKVQINNEKEQVIQEAAIGTISIRTSPSGKVKKKIKEVFSEDENNISCKIKYIVANGVKYLLYSDIIATLEKEDDYYIISYDLLGLVGTGKTIAAAKVSFFEEFDFMYKRYSTMEEDKISPRLVRIKALMNLLVNKIQ